MYRTNAVMLPLAAALLLTGPLSAQAQTAPTLEPLSMDAVVYPELVTWHEREGRPCCFPEVVAEDGQVLLRIDIVFDIPWSEELNRVSANSSDIKVTLPDGTTRTPIGSYQYEGQFRRSSMSFSVSRPNNWAEQDRDGFFNAVFLIPQGTPSVTLAVGELYSTTVEVPQTFQKPPRAGDGAEFQVLRTQLLDGVTSAERVDGVDVSNDISPPEGQAILEVEVSIRGVERNDFDTPDRYYWHTYDFAVVYDDVHNAGLIGERFSNKILNWQFNSTEVGGQPTIRTIYFAVPADVGTMHLYFGDERIADLTAN